MLVFLLDILAGYFAFGVLADTVSLTMVLITTAKLGTTPLAFYEAVKAIASPAGATEGLSIVEKAKAAVSSIKVAQVREDRGRGLGLAAAGIA